MFKYVLSLAFAVGLASAATISTNAACNGVATVGTTGAFCDDGFFIVHAGISAPSFVDTRIAPFPEFQVSVDVLSFPGPPFPPGPPPHGGGALANFSDDYVFTVFGGTGNGFFCPVIDVRNGSGAMAGITFAGISGAADCSVSKPFTFGVPQIVNISMGGQASALLGGQADASASFGPSLGQLFPAPILFSDPAGNPLSNVTFTLVSVELPEPSAWSLLSIGLTFLVVVRMISSRLANSRVRPSSYVLSTR